MKVPHHVQRFTYAFAGIFYALTHDRSYRAQFYFGGAFVIFVIYFFSPLSQLELMFTVLSWVLVLITELQNSAFEAALDRIHPERHSDIGKSKDMAAGAVLIAGLFALLVFSFIVYNHFLVLYT